MKSDIDFKIDYSELMDDFAKLKVSVQNRTIETGLRKSGRIIMAKVKSNFQSIKKDKSKTNYVNFNRLLKMERIKTRNKYGIGVKIGFTMEGYKYRWINWGTYVRSTKNPREKKIHQTGLVQQTNFFYNAVKQTEKQVADSIEQNVINQIKKVVKKYNSV